ncbi:MAG: PKD domain-containing protein [Solirubrobacteraceae bacterium]|nr:PKD domain-containing protein [Solirubrobacteraceae bacterium]
MGPNVRAIVASISVALAAPLALAPSANAAGRPSKVASVVEQSAADVAAARRAGRSPAGASHRLVRVRTDGSIEVNVWAHGQVSNRERAQLIRLGARIVATASGPARRGRPAYGLFHAAVPADDIDAVAALDWVAALTTPDYGQTDDHPTNPTNSQGVALHNADDVQTRGINGAGVNVGVISNGVPSLAASDLPAVTVNNAGCAAGSPNCDEGTAMLEIVHDMAPGAGLLFDAGTGGGTAGHVGAQNWLAANGANVITEDLAFDAEPAFQSGLVASNGDTVAANGVSMHSSAGNLGARHAARMAATGTGQGPDGGTGPCAGNEPDNAVAIAGGTDNTFDITAANNASLTLQWSEPRAIFPTAGQGGFTDLDLYVLNAAGTACIAQSNNGQGQGVGDTLEQIGGLAAGTYKVVVDVENAPAGVAVPTLDLRMRATTSVDTATRAGSLNPDSNYTGAATSAAALDAQNSGALEGYSAGGPVQLLITTQCPGGAAGPCGAGQAGTVNQTAGAPTWAAADNVAVTGVGGFGSPFTGTSAAAPHAAACDALLRDELNQPAAAPATTNARLAATAADIAPAGVDNVTGAGRLDCLQAINDPPSADAGGPYSTAEGTDVTLDGSLSSDPDTGDTLTYDWDFDADGAFDDATGASPPFDRVGRDGSFTVSLRVTDTAGATATDSATVNVTNVAPQVSAIATDDPVDENTAVSVSGTISDAGWLDPLSATIDFGDGAGAEALAGIEEHLRPDGTITYDVEHVYGDDGTFTITVCGADDDVANICRTAEATVDNVDPTAAINEDDAVSINGTPVLLGNSGAPVDFAGRATDPGSDDLTLRWDWDDGAPAIDRSTLLLVNAPFPDPDPSPSVQPRDVTDETAHAFGQACTYDVGFSVLDDDGGSASDAIKVLIAGNADRGRPTGYWAQQYRQRGGVDFDDATLACYLEIADFVSAVFHEERDAATFQKAQKILFSQGQAVGKRDQLDRDLLTAWLNFANGAVGWAEAVDTNGDGTADTAFSAALQAAEAVRLDANATPAQLDAQRAIVQAINDGLV